MYMIVILCVVMINVIQSCYYLDMLIVTNQLYLDTCTVITGCRKETCN